MYRVFQLLRQVAGSGGGTTNTNTFGEERAGAPPVCGISASDFDRLCAHLDVPKASADLLFHTVREQASWRRPGLRAGRQRRRPRAPSFSPSQQQPHGVKEEEEEEEITFSEDEVEAE